MLWTILAFCAEAPPGAMEIAIKAIAKKANKVALSPRYVLQCFMILIPVKKKQLHSFPLKNSFAAAITFTTLVVTSARPLWEQGMHSIPR
jgi:hypothetical protein